MNKTKKPTRNICENGSWKMKKKQVKEYSQSIFHRKVQRKKKEDEHIQGGRIHSGIACRKQNVSFNDVMCNNKRRKGKQIFY